MHSGEPKNTFKLFIFNIPFQTPCKVLYLYKPVVVKAQSFLSEMWVNTRWSDFTGPTNIKEHQLLFLTGVESSSQERLLGYKTFQKHGSFTLLNKLSKLNVSFRYTISCSTACHKVMSSARIYSPRTSLLEEVEYIHCDDFSSVHYF